MLALTQLTLTYASGMLFFDDGSSCGVRFDAAAGPQELGGLSVEFW